MNDCRKKEITTAPLEANQNQEMLDFIPSLFGVRGAWILTQTNVSLGHKSTIFWVRVFFPNKVTIPCPNTSSLHLLVCHWASSMSSYLDLVILLFSFCPYRKFIHFWSQKAGTRFFCAKHYQGFLFFFFFFSFFCLCHFPRPLWWYMEVPRLGVESEL